jgi:hypothetical protein
MPIQAPTKSELMTLIRRFIRNKDRGISIKLFCQAAGLDKFHFMDIFWYRTVPLTEKMQIRVSKAYEAWRDGKLSIMQNRNRTKYVDYRETPQPRVLPTTRLEMINGNIKIKVGMRNIDDYSQPPILEGDSNAGTP